MDRPRTPEPAAGQPTLPDSISITFQGYPDRDEGERLAGVLIDCVRSVSSVIDLGSLDGLTLAHDYRNAVHTLDRGCDNPSPPRLSDAETIGVGIVLAVVRNGQVKNHIVFRADAVSGLLQSQEGQAFRIALYALARACGQVEAQDCFERAFVGATLGLRQDHPHDAQRWDIILACWNAFAACWISASFAGDLADKTEDDFLQHLATAKDAAGRRVAAYQEHADRQMALAEVYAVYGSLMKRAARHLGTMLGLGASPTDYPKTVAALDGHWFADAFQEMDSILRRLASQLGTWPDKAVFEPIADIADGLIEANELKALEALSGA
ncbi:MAG: hypothetical protein AB7O04_16685 [Hyphomonadaceae bacterium]